MENPPFYRVATQSIDSLFSQSFQSAMIDYQIVSTEISKDMDVTLSWDTIFGVLDAARKYMVEDAAGQSGVCMA